MIRIHISVGGLAKKKQQTKPKTSFQAKLQEEKNASNPTPSFIAASYVGYELFHWTVLSAFLLKNEELINYFKFEVIKPSAVRLTWFSQQAAGFFYQSEGFF